MASTLVREPFHRPGWIYEEKLDGWRTIAAVLSQQTAIAG
jgi:ATP-dependent DNA ligase